MNRVTTQAIVLRRTEFGESDRIVTFMTSDLGKITAMVKGARKLKSRLAAGVELLTVSEVSLIEGKKMYTLVSARPQQQLKRIPTDLTDLNHAYALIKKVNDTVEEGEGKELFEVLREALVSLEEGVEHELVSTWFFVLLLTHYGQQPNLEQDQAGLPLEEEKTYILAPSTGGFVYSESSEAVFTANAIKALRLMSRLTPRQLTSVGGVVQVVKPIATKINDFANYHLG